MDNEKWFEYALYDAWHTFLASVSVMNDGKNTVFFGKGENGRWGRPDLHEQQSISISDASMLALKDILQDSRLYEIKEIEITPVFDGYIQDFLFYDGVHTSKLTADNIAYCVGRAEEFPNATVILGAFSRIAELLALEGIGREYFKLKRS